MIAQAIVGPHMLVKAESSPIADVWYRDRPMRELSERLIDRYREMLARMIDAVRLYIEQHIVSGRLGKSARPALVTPEQLDAIRRIIGDHHAAFVAGGIEPSAISPYELQRLRASGLVTGDLVYVFGTGTAPMRVIEDAFQYGRDLGSVSHPKEKRPIEARSYQEWRDRTAQPPMTEAERSAVSWANTKAAQEIRGLGNRVSDNFATIAIEVDQEQRRQYENVIREELAANVEAREGWRKVVTALGDRTDDWARDLGRIAATEKHGALQEGQAAAMKRKSGRKSGDVRVAKQPNHPDACKNCLRLFMEGGTPRIFWLSELEANGTNVGRKVAEWLPTVGPVHPWCFPAGTSIETEAGPLAIEVVETGTLVRTHLGRLRAVQRLSQRIHRGDLVVITAGDDLLEATPEHPLLTQRGWVRASAVEIGDQLFRTPHLATTAQEPGHREADDGSERILRGVLRALARRRVPVGIDLHEYTEIRQPEVEAVRTDRELWDRCMAALTEQLEHRAFVRGHRAVALAGLRRLHLLADRPRLSTTHAMCCLREALSLFRAASRVHDEELLAVGSDPHTGSEESRGDRFPRSGVLLREFENALSALVSGDDLGIRQDESVAHDVHYHAVPVTSTTRRPFDGVVYNFSVEEDESYVAGGFAVHNCACELVEVPEGWAFDENGDLVPEILKRSALLESSLQKSAASLKQPMLFGGAGGDGGVTVRIGDPLLRAAVEAVIARTPSEIFTRATGVTLITTDHPRLTNALDDGDLAYWTGNEIRIVQSIEPARVKRVLEHEIGHSLNAWLRTKFGDTAKVRAWHDQLWAVSGDEGFVTTYAKREPIENAAEVTRLFIYHRDRLREHWPRQFSLCLTAYGDLLKRPKRAV